MKAVVTGGAGFIGSHLCERLVGEGYEVVAIDDLSGTDKRVPLLERADVEIRELDIRSEKASDAILRIRPDVVFHLAAQIDVRRSVADPVFDASVNIAGSLNILEAVRETGSRFIFASSGGCIYGEPGPDLLPVAESVSGRPTSPYGISKKVLIDYLQFYADTHSLNFTTLALANVYGPRQDPHGEAGVVAMFGLRLLACKPCTIYGDGDQTRDFVFVTDVVEAFVRAIGAGKNELINISTAKETSVTELYSLMASLAGVASEATYAPARAGELERSCLANDRAREVLGWSPRTDLREGLSRTLEHLALELKKN